MVLAGLPVTSLMRFAARPVGAASATLSPSSSNSWRIPFRVVVFPVPGPPVRIKQTALNGGDYRLSLEIAVFYAVLFLYSVNFPVRRFFCLREESEYLFHALRRGLFRLVDMRQE